MPPLAFSFSLSCFLCIFSDFFILFSPRANLKRDKDSSASGSPRRDLEKKEVERKKPLKLRDQWNEELKQAQQQQQAGKDAQASLFTDVFSSFYFSLKRKKIKRNFSILFFNLLIFIKVVIPKIPLKSSDPEQPSDLKIHRV